MKTCPKCKAQVQENARFCLYCMTSFEEKQLVETPQNPRRRWVYGVIAAVVAVTVLGMLLLVPKSASSNGEIGAPTSSLFSGHVTSLTDTRLSTASNSTQTSHTTNGYSEITSTTSCGTTAAQTTAVTARSTSSSSKTTAKPTATTVETTVGTSAVTTVPAATPAVYTYRDARHGDDFSVYANIENSVVITGVQTASADGNYAIPATLDGKTVIAVMPLAFCDDGICATVKTVVIPPSVKTVWGNAFATCYGLTDIYLTGNAVYIETTAFADAAKRNGKFTIHCSADCNDRNFRYYKDSASHYGAEYEEWNG